jgi:hypothetical protein
MRDSADISCDLSASCGQVARRGYLGGKMRGVVELFSCAPAKILRLARMMVACIGLAASTAGCNLLVEEKLIAEGIGTTLPAEDIVETTRRLDTYLSYLCVQAGMGRFEARAEGPEVICETRSFDGTALTLLVRAGFNDIDRRCDGYLAWLNSRRRDRTAVLSQLTDTRNFTEALLNATGAGTTAVTAVGLAFGLASNTFTNYYSRLLLEVEKSTVEVLVHEKRLKYREDLNIQISTMPDAIHVLREYLLICTPHYIENRINQRARDSVAGNEPADKGHTDQIRKGLVAAALLKSIPKGPREPLPGVGGQPGGPKPEPKITGGDLNGLERGLLLSTAKTIQINLCVEPANGNFGPTTREAIRQAKLGAEGIIDPRPFNNLRNQISNEKEVEIFRGAKSCSQDFLAVERGYKTPFEKFGFSDGPTIKSLQRSLTRCDSRVRETGIFDSATRSAIRIAKDKTSAQLKATLTDLNTDTLNDKSHVAVVQTCI